MRFRISAAINLLGVLVFAGLLASSAASFYAIQQLRVGGPLYDRIVLGKDLVADILPPPAYVIEAYLVTRLALDAPDTVAEAKARLAQLHTEYDERHAFWGTTTTLPPALKRDMVEVSHTQVQRFWREIEEDFLPALERGDVEGARASMGEVAAAYADHRAIVDRMVVAANEMNATVEAEAAQARIILGSFAGLTAFGAAVMLIAGIWAVRTRLVRPILRMAEVMTRLAAGEEDIATPYRDRADEMGEMARSVEVFRQAAAERQALRASEEAERSRAAETREQAIAEREAEDRRRGEVMARLGLGLERLSAGDLSLRLTEAFPPEYEKLRRDFNAAMDELARTLGAISEASDDVRSGAGDISVAADNLAQRTEQQAAALEETAAALDEITATIRKTAEGAEAARRMVAEARDAAVNSDGVVTQAIEAMSRIERSSDEIGQIIAVIDEIAFQTNLLALNAGVEAARAGDAGKGFAVVASEVRALAQRSAEAAKEIKNLVSTSGAEVQGGVQLVGGAGEALKLIAAKVGEIHDLVVEMAASAREQAAGIGQVNTAVADMDRSVQQNAAMVEETTAASHGLANQAEDLARRVGRFHLDRAEADDSVRGLAARLAETFPAARSA
ncbi:MAG: methyl-accepting chemotaxis protein [Phenylobacterium sp.]|uniref:methyl-accepting chemotaxis protein n=1 Tax=Phenylobacterium sp. TaxID=1871053 RepID=UPI00391D49BA